MSVSAKSLYDGQHVVVAALAEDMAVALAAWPCPVDSVRPLGGGWNSSTWLVVTPGGRRFVAKLADHLGAEALAAGLRVAEFALLCAA